MENAKASAYLDSNMSKADKVVVEAVLASYKNAPARPLFTEWGQVWGTWETHYFHGVLLNQKVQRLHII
jgi:arabinogalactan oligomer / maltooligosaccharide transport system substrate-binding protein